MRWFEVDSGLRLAVSSEERELLDRIGDQAISQTALDARQHELARLMVTRGLLNRFNKNGQEFYSVCSVTDIWRSRHDR